MFDPLPPVNSSVMKQVMPDEEPDKLSFAAGEEGD